MMRSNRRGRWLALLCLAGLGCATPGPTVLGPEAVREGVRQLSRPLPGAIGALYRVRVPETGGLRMILRGDALAGRLVVSKPMGGAVGAVVWDGEETRALDLEHGCRVSAERISEVIGLGVVPAGQAVRLLGGRLPEDDEGPRTGSDGLVSGEGWIAALEREPWRVVRFSGGRGWTLSLSRHTSSVPGFARLEREDGEWVELELVHLEWDPPVEPEPLPELPPCGSVEPAGR